VLGIRIRNRIRIPMCLSHPNPSFFL
jgi:hypothetical protein